MKLLNRLHAPPKGVFYPGTHVECCNNDGAPELVIGSFYWVIDYYRPRWFLHLFCPDEWGIAVFPHAGMIYHHSHFRIPTRPVKPDDFNLVEGPFSR